MTRGDFRPSTWTRSCRITWLPDPADKLVLGVPFYGHVWESVGYTSDGLYQLGAGPKQGKYESGSLYYTEILTDYLPEYKRHWNAESQVPWLYNINTAVFVSYDDPESIAAKAGYAQDKHLAGIMIWELSQGDAAMLDAIQTGFQKGGTPHLQPTRDPNAVIIPRPFAAQIHSVSGIKVDGNLDDWTGDPTFTLNDKAQLAFKLSSSSWSGPADLSGEIWTGWTPEGLYFAVKVVDDVHVQKSSDENIWHGDYVEWQFDTQLEKDRDRKSMNSDDYQIGVSAGDFAAVARWRMPGSTDLTRPACSKSSRPRSRQLMGTFWKPSFLQGSLEGYHPGRESHLRHERQPERCGRSQPGPESHAVHLLHPHVCRSDHLWSDHSGEVGADPSVRPCLCLSCHVSADVSIHWRLSQGARNSK